ncbi:MAG: hypothetical protein QGG42_01305 [Phycisphaerae bacterium]|jgi:cytochrome c biogenesis protein CcdA|nr:hypothetical protein [Phycisphaerae bacterium]
MGDMTIAVLVAFYLFLATRWDLVRRPLPFVVGVLAVIVVILAGFFNLGRSTVTVGDVFTIIGALVAFAAGIATCANMKLPIDMSALTPDTVEEPEE